MLNAASEILASLPAPSRRAVLAAGISGLLSLIFLVLAILPLKAELISSDVRITSAGPLLSPGGLPPGAQPPGAQPPGVSPEQTQFLTGSFSLKIGKRFKGQRIAFDRVVLFDEKGKELGSIKIGPVTRIIKLQQSDDKSAAPSSSESVQGTLFLWPLEEGQITFPAFAQKSFGVAPGAKIYAEIQGDSGIRSFKVKTPVKPAQGFGP